MANTQGIRAGRAYVELGVDDRITSGLRKAEQRMKAFASGLRSAGLQLTGLAAAVGAPAAVASASFAEFEQRMARVKALTNANEKQFTDLWNEAKRLGATTIYTAKQAADAMAFFALAGYDVDKILKSIGPTLDMAAAGLMDVTQAADIAVKIMAGAGFNADELTGAVDIMTKAMTTANTDLIQLGEAMKYVGPVAKNAGISFEELTAAVQMLSNAGIQGQMAGTTLRGAILSLTDPSKEAADLLSNLGVSILDKKGDMRSLADIIEDLSRATAGLGKGQVVGMIGRLFDARQAAGFAELLSQGADRMRKMTASLRQAKGTAARVAGVQLDTLKGDVVILRSAAEGLQITFGAVLGPMLRTVTRYITDIVNVVSKWVERNARLIRNLSLVVAGVGALGVGLLGLSFSVTVLAKVLGGLALISKTITVVLGGIVTVLTSLLSPVGLAIAAIAALGTVIVIASGKGSEALRWLTEQFQSLTGFVSKSLGAIADALVAGDISLAAKVLWTSLKLAWQEGVNTLNVQWAKFKNAFLTLATDAFYGAVTLAAEAFYGLQKLWVETTSFLASKWTRFSGDFRELWTIAQNEVTKGWVKLMAMFDERIDVDYATKIADSELNDKLAKIERETQSSMAATEKGRKEKRAAIEQERIGTLTAINEEADAAQRARQQEYGKEIDATRAALAKAKADWQAAVTQANAKQPGKDKEGKAPESLADRIKKAISAVPDALETARGRSLEAVGTFNVAAAYGFGAQSTQERTAKATEETARNTNRIIQKMTGGQSFA